MNCLTLDARKQENIRSDATFSTPVTNLSRAEFSAPTFSVAPNRPNLVESFTRKLTHKSQAHRQLRNGAYRQLDHRPCIAAYAVLIMVGWHHC